MTAATQTNYSYVFTFDERLAAEIDEDLFAELKALESDHDDGNNKKAGRDKAWGDLESALFKHKVSQDEGHASTASMSRSFSSASGDAASVETDDTFSELTAHPIAAEQSTLAENNSDQNKNIQSNSDSSFDLRKLMDKENNFQDVVVKADKTIAELFPEATVFFADVSGFTAWSSMREANQVFILLESIFQSFDEIAKRRNVFKVETVGDCYVAVCGLPEANKEHAIVMASFARECVKKFKQVVHGLEMKLGPDTGELAIRIGLNSGPVTAGVIRGERARLQLFGDTVNTAARIESTGERGRIHISEQTASLLKQAGYEGWVSPRKDIVSAKGKGRMETFWLKQNPTDTSLHTRPLSAMQEDATLQDRLERCTDYITELLLDLLKKVVAHRIAVKGPHALKEAANTSAQVKGKAKNIGHGQLIVEEVANIIELPDFDDRAILADPEAITFPPKVVTQCRAYVAAIASSYKRTPFHNFEHATHVTQSMYKILSRIVAPKLDDNALDAATHEERLKSDHTYGITSDPLTQFSVVFSALIHDADHRGIPNFILQKEDKALATVYKNKSVAEQNSVEVGWELLLQDEFEAFRVCIFGDDSEMQRFRQLLVNAVIATDIFDKEQSALRKNRWARAFSEESASEDQRVAKNRKATIVIEHLIQASDVSHCMQHWHVYQKWNERLFHESYAAFLDGRSDKDPSDGWYKGEIWFFDNYIIPLAKKLKNCGVFGVTSDEYLMYATTNRNEWVIKGESIVESLKKKYSR